MDSVDEMDEMDEMDGMDGMDGMDLRRFAGTVFPYFRPCPPVPLSLPSDLHSWRPHRVPLAISL